MKKLLFLICLVIVSPIIAQVDVQDCATYMYTPSQAEIDAAQDHFASCITLGGTENIHIHDTDNKNVYAATSIHLKNGFHAGKFKPGGQAHLQINEKSNLQVSVMNYPDLNSVLRYKKIEFGIKIPSELESKINHFLFEQGTYSDELNPFVDWDIDVEATFYHPTSGWYQIIDGYYTRDYHVNPITNDWDDIHTPFPFRIRFAPPQNGNWQATIVIKINKQIAYESPTFMFNVVESGDLGYVKVHSNKRNLVRGNKIIFPVGHNFPSPEQHTIPWGGHGSPDYLGNNLFSDSTTFKAANTLEWQAYREKVEDYFQLGGRFIRTLQTPWSSLIEFEKKGNYYDRLHYAWEQDHLLDLCDQYDALVQFNLMIHTPFVRYTTIEAFDWDNYSIVNDQSVLEYDADGQAYCYNDNPALINGEKVQNCLEDPEDLKYHKQRTRYYIARYGYSTNIYEFELLSEPFNIDARPGNFQIGDSLDYKINVLPYKNYPENQDLFDAIETYQKTLADYIKDSMEHKSHLIGVDYGYYPADADSIDFSFQIDNVDVIGLNIYNASYNKYYISNKNSIAKTILDYHIYSGFKPIIFSEFGDGDDYMECSNFTGHYVDVMSAGFTGVCGFNMWFGKEIDRNFLWPSTIRAQNHMNGADVLNTLENGSGDWVQGKQMSKIKNYIKDKNVEAVEHQYYVSNNKELAVGYVRNRTYNIQTKRIDNDCNLLWNIEPINSLKIIDFTDVPLNKRLKVEGLKDNTNYTVDFYNFKTGNYIYTDCDNTSYNNGKLTIRFPYLYAIDNPNLEELENPVVWYVVKQNNCMIGIDQVDSEISNLEEQILTIEDVESSQKTLVYPNPFDDYLTVKSLASDLLIFQDINGKVIYRQKINAGITQINTIELPKGFYVLVFDKQKIRTKLLKL